jgi:hypothetical protein
VQWPRGEVPSARRGVSRRSARKTGGRPKGSLGPKARAIREAVLALTAEYEVMTVRQVFYALSVRGIVPKDENAGYRPVQAHVLKMRREGLLPWSFIADGTRWQRKPETWDSVEDAVRETQRTYRRNLWRSQDLRVEVWLEKDALAAVVADVTDRWDVPLMVSRGTSSATFLHSAGEEAKRAYLEAGISTQIFALYDFDAAGRRAARSVENGLREFGRLPSGNPVPIEFDLLAVTEHEIDMWRLATRPAKKTDPEAHKFGSEAVELDAIPPDKLVELVENAIIQHIDPRAWRVQEAVERMERDGLLRLRLAEAA